jgi:hypothetical protein
LGEKAQEEVIILRESVGKALKREERIKAEFRALNDAGG